MKKIIIIFTVLASILATNAQGTITKLDSWLKKPVGKLSEQSFATKALTKEEASNAFELIYAAKAEEVKNELQDQWKDKCLKVGNLQMKLKYVVYGDCPADGRSLYISMHGGGKTEPEVNDQQWANQIRLYRPKEGVYVAPRAPVDDWDMWAKPHLEDFYLNLIKIAVIELNVNPDKVYITGYSAGGDGTWRMAPRMADTWAASAMMAGHPGGVKLLNLRNTPFQIWMGENDSAYDRNKQAVIQGEIMDSLQKDDPEGYIHETHIVKGVGHWMKRADTTAIEWMAQYRRNPYPTKIVWRQDGARAHETFYWVQVDKEEAKVDGKMVRIERSGNKFTITENDYQKLIINLSDQMVDFSKPIEVVQNGKTIFRKKVSRTILDIDKSLNSRMDKSMHFCGHITIIK